MNFLAHLYLSGENDDVRLGNFIGDFIKGKTGMENFSNDVVRGIELHRAIDEYTDTHPIVMESKERLRPKYRHYSPVIVDMYYDHFLAKNWSNYHPTPLPDYADEVYDMIMGRKDILPEQVSYMMPFMIRGNWLVNYARIEGIGRALTGMAQRTRYKSKMEEATEELIKDYDAFLDEFTRFFPELRKYCDRWIAEN